MRIAIGADHAGFALKQHLVATLRASATRSTTTARTARSRSTTRRSAPASAARSPRAARIAGSSIGGSGQGEQIAANKVDRRARGALQRSLHRAHVARSTTTPTSSRSAGASSPSGLADEIVDALARHRRSRAAATSAGSTRSSSRSERRASERLRLQHEPQMPTHARPKPHPAGERSRRPIPRSRAPSATSGTARTAASS